MGDQVKKQIEQNREKMKINLNGGIKQEKLQKKIQDSSEEEKQVEEESSEENEGNVEEE